MATTYGSKPRKRYGKGSNFEPNINPLMGQTIPAGTRAADPNGLGAAVLGQLKPVIRDTVAAPVAAADLGGGGSSGGSGDGGIGAAAASSTAQANQIYDNQLKTLAREVAGGRTSIEQAGAHLRGLLSGLGKDAAGQQAKVGAGIRATSRSAQAEAARTAAALSADLATQGFSAQGVTNKARVESQQIAAQGRGQNDLNTRYAQLLGQDVNARRANEGLLTTGSQNDLTRLNALSTADIAQQRAAALAQIQQDAAAAAAKARSGGGGGGSGSGSGLTLSQFGAALSAGEKYGKRDIPPPSYGDILRQSFGGNNDPRARNELAALLSGSVQPANEYERLHNQTKSGDTRANGAILDALRNVLTWKKSNLGKQKPQTNADIAQTLAYLHARGIK